MKKHYLLAAAVLSAGWVSAQTDMTSMIANPSFETNGLKGWTNDGMAAQGNDAFALKKGSVYAEKWTGSGGVGNASLTQTLSALPAGTYTVTAAAQNVQQKALTDVQTGVYLVANDAKSSVNAAGEYSVSTTIADGSLSLGLVLKGATGNYVCVDDFRLTLENPAAETYAAIHEALRKLVDEANSVDQKNGTKEQQELDEARTAVENLMSQDTTEGVTDAVLRLKAAIYDYRLSVASPDADVDMTDNIANPNFEDGGSDGWTNEGMSAQGNTAFSKKSGSTYMEAWTGAGGSIGNRTLSQQVDLPNGKYVLTAAAQCIQQGSGDKASKGAYLFADEYEKEVGKSASYSLEFVVIENQVTLGFKTRNADGNWVAVDNFKLKYQGRSEEMLMEALRHRCESVEPLAAKHMNAATLSQLQKTLADAKALTDTNGIAEVAKALREWGEAAETSASAYASLADMLAKANSYGLEGQGTEEFSAAVAKAQQEYDEASLTEDGVAEAVDELDNAILRYRVANATGEVPEVTTVQYVARGATGALGRSIVKGKNIKEKGFCWSTDPEPTVLDNRTTFSYDINGPMYLMQPLEPATVYYVRAYAMTEDYAVGYGEVRKVITLPMGTSTYSYNNGGPADANVRINNALADCIRYYNNWSCTTNFNISCSYGSGTPTADCGYGGGMRVGPNASYQRTGTILHESNHGVGVGTSSRWWDTSLHDGNWKGWRANSLLQFIENNSSSKMAGDSMHMWPYGINGAHEDSGWPMLYIANVMITQALHEDGLVPPGHGGCKPAYVFEQDDNVKYYITNENANYGSATAYLTESANGTLSWSAPEEGVAGDDAYAWYTTFDPKRQLYTIRNAKSGRYFSYGSNIKTVNKAAPATSEYFHLMVGRDEKVLGSKSTGVKTHSYWIMAGNDVFTPLALTAQSNGKTSSTSFDISDAASAQRWFILTEDEMAQIASSTIDLNCEKLLSYVKEGKNMAKVEHSDLKENATADFESLLSLYETSAPSMTDADELANALENVKTGMDAFLNGTKLADEAHPYDLTFMVTDPAMSNPDVWGVAPTVSYNCSEFYQNTFSMTQKLLDMPSGKYSAHVQAFQRPGSYTDVYNKFSAGTLTTTAKMSIVGVVPVKSIMDDAVTTKVGTGAEQHVGQYYIPDNMQAADAYFRKGLYDNELRFDMEKRGDMTVRFFNNTVVDKDWTIFRNFRLYHLGGVESTDTAVDGVNAAGSDTEHSVYTIQGVKVDGTVDSLQPGMYIIDGKTVYKK